MELEGQLHIFPLRELIEMIRLSSVRGLLEIQAEDLHARLYFYDGQPVHATVGVLEGLAAVGRMFEFSEGNFWFDRHAVCEQVTLWLDADDLIARGQQLARQWLPLRQDITSLDLVPTLVDGNTNAQVQISEQFWPVLAAVDGQSSIQAIADQLRLDPYDVCITLVMLKQRGLITLVPLQVRTAQPLANPPLAEQQGFFERLIDQTLAEEAQNPNSRYAPPIGRYVETE